MANQNQNDEQASEIQQLSMAEREIPSNLALLKMQNDSISALAVAHPRDMAKIKKDLELAIADFPELAYSAIYAKPVGKCVDVVCTCGHKYESAVSRNQNEAPICPRCQEQTAKSIGRPRQKFARDLSIRAAETLAEVYGYNYVRADVNPTETGAKVEATFTDYQRGRIWQASAMVSRFYRGRNGAMQSIDESRFNDTVVKAAQSKLIREVINRSVSGGLKAWFKARCEEIQGELLTAETLDKMTGRFSEFNLTLADLERIIGRPSSLGWTNQDRQTLLGIYSGLKSGDLSVRELFSDLDPPETPKTGNGNAGSASGSVSGSDLTTRKPQADKAAESKPEGQNGTKTAPQETKQPASETKPGEPATQAGGSGTGAGEPPASTGAASPEGEFSEEEKAAIAKQEFEGACKEKFAAEFDTIQKAKSGSKLDGCFQGIAKDTTSTENEKGVMYGWIRARRAALKK